MLSNAGGAGSRRGSSMSASCNAISFGPDSSTGRRASRRDESADQPKSLPLRSTGDGKTMANLFRRLNPTRAFNGLWRHGDFVRLWSSLTITHFGGQITFLALPLTGALLLDAT